MNEILSRDQNHITVLGGVTDDSNQFITMLRVDPVTKRLLISGSFSGMGTVTSITAGTGLTATPSNPITTTGTIALDSKLAPLDTLGTAGQSVRVNAGATALEYFTPGAGSGTVTGIIIASANGLAGTSDGNTATPTLTFSTTVTGILKGNGTAISAATVGTDYVTASSTNTFTNKTYDTAGAGNSLSINGVAATANTGTGAIARAAGPTFTTPTLGVASATTVNKVTITAPATGSTLTIADGKTFTASNTLTFTGTDGSSVAFGTGGTVLYSSSTVPLTVSSTTISSGTTTRILYDNAGVLGEYTITGTGTVVAMQTSPSFTTPTLGAATATTINGNTFTTGTYTLTGTAGKTLTFSNSITLAGTDATTMTFPGTSATIARTDAAQTFTGTQTFAQVITTANAITASSNAATIPVTSRHNIVTNNSAATLTLTLTTAGAVNMQMVVVQILDFSAVAETITWVNTENSTVSVPGTSNGSTTLPLTVGFIYNSATSKWRCVASA